MGASTMLNRVSTLVTLDMEKSWIMINEMALPVVKHG